MRFYYDLDLNSLVLTPGLTAIVSAANFKFLTTPNVEIQFVKQGVIFDPGAPDLVYFLIKQAGQYSSTTAYVLQTSFTKTGTGATAVWSGNPSFDTAALRTAFVSGGADVPTVSGSVEIGMVQSGLLTASLTITGNIQNTEFRGTEAATALTAGYWSLVAQAPTITSYVGTTSTALAAVATAGGSMALGVIVGVTVGGAFSFFKLQTGTASIAWPAVGRPNDYDATTNAVNWVQVGPTDPGAIRLTAIDTDPTFAANSDVLVPSQKAVKTALAAKSGIIVIPNTVFVETSGNDTTGDGSRAKPWQTLQHAIDVVGGTKLIQMGVGFFGADGVGSTPLHLRGVGQSKTKVQIHGQAGVDGQYSTGVFHCNLIDAAAALTEGLTGGDPDTPYRINLQTSSSTIPDPTSPWFTVTTDSSGNVSLAALRAALIAVGDYTFNFGDLYVSIGDYDAPYVLLNVDSSPLPFTGGLDGLTGQVTGRITVTKTIRNQNGTVGGDVTLYASALFLDPAWSGRGGNATTGGSATGGNSGNLFIYADGTVMGNLITVGDPGINGGDVGGYAPDGNLTLENVKTYQAFGDTLSLKTCSVYSASYITAILDYCADGYAADADAGSGHGTSGGDAPSTNSFGLLFNLMD